ncbi:MAG: agmatinase [Nitrososphaerales archaeon]
MMTYREFFIARDPLITMLKEGVPPIVRVFGVPFDATSTYRPGSRFGANAIREAFMNIEVYSTMLGIDLEDLSIEDLGNLRYTTSIDQMVYSVEKVVYELIHEGKAFAMLGGEHTATFGACSAMPKDSALIVFDAHLDLRDSFADLKLSHATFLRRLLEKKDAQNTIIIGSRAASSEEWRMADKIGLTIISADSLYALKNPQKLLKDFISDFEKVYISIDLDVLDPAYAPAVGNPEPIGISTRQLLEFLYTLKGKEIIGFDIMELSPPYDNGSTACVAAKLLAELTCLTYLGKVKNMEI